MPKKSKSITTDGVKFKVPELHMTSREVVAVINSLRPEGKAELRHDSFVTKLLKLKEELTLQNILEREFKTERGNVYTEYLLDKEVSILMVASETPKVLRVIIKRWLELETAFANQPRAGILQDKRSAHHPMMDALIDLRQSLGKETTTVHFMSENKLCNGVVTGNFKSAKEDTLSNEEAMLLAEVRRMNQSMLQMDMGYDERKKKLVAFATKRRTKLLSQ